MGSDNAVMPDDYRTLLGETGAGTLAGVLRLLAPGGPAGFNMADERAAQLAGGCLASFQRDDKYMEDVITGMRLEDDHYQPIIDARLWGVFTTGETCWWLPFGDDSAGWPLLIASGEGWQQLSMPTTEFLHQWADGRLDLPVLSHGAVRRQWQIIPAGQPVTVPEPPTATRDAMAQLSTLVGPGQASLSFDWAAIEADLGRPIPPDYKTLFEAYGRGDDDGEPYGTGLLAWNGIYVPSPVALKKTHELFAEGFSYVERHPSAGSVTGGDLLLCASTVERELLAWDTRNPDPAQWPVLYIEAIDSRVLPGTLTDVIIAALTRVLRIGYEFDPEPYGQDFESA